MSVSVDCDRCGKRYRVNERLAGKKVRCKVCGESLRVPAGAGGTIIRHEPRMREFEFAVGDGESIEQISAHIEQHIGPVSTVYHEIISDLVHVDVHMMPPSGGRDHYTLVTSGMSDRPMTVPEGAEECRYAELMLSLPAGWPLSEEDFRDERNYWPVRWLKILARFPHEYETWLWYHHTVPNGDPPEPFAPNTGFCCAILLPPLLVPEQFHELRLTEEKKVRFLAVVPLYREELNFKLKHGSERLIERLDKHQVTELIDLERPNSCRRRLWPF